MSSKSLTYKQAGVDIDAADSLVDRISSLVKKTETSRVLSSIGHYAGLFELGSGVKNPVLVSSTDGVGTKLKLALDYGDVSGLGQDLVAMSANDILCLGATPLFFLDYFATGKLDVKTAAAVVGGIAKACASIRCALLGGETAEMPTLYTGKDFDLAGFVVGVVDKSKIIDGRTIRPGDQIIGVASSGVHSNGFSLVRKIISEKKLSLRKKYPGLKQTLGSALLEPTRLYVNTILRLKEEFDLHGIAHITGGGLVENLPRLFPKNCRAVLRGDAWPRPALFQLLQSWGNVSDAEMWRVFNCGIGLALVVPAAKTEKIMARLKSLKEKAWVIGEMEERKKKGLLEIF